MDPIYLANQLREEGNQEFKAKQYIAAIKKYNAALAIYYELCDLYRNPKDVAILFCNKALCLFKLQKWSDAYSSAEQALRFDPTFIKAYYWAGCSLIEMMAVDQALLVFLSGVKLASSNASQDLIAELVVSIMTIINKHPVFGTDVYFDEIFKKRFSTDVWRMVFEKLAYKDLWRILHYLIVFGKRHLPVELSTSHVSLKGLFEDIVSRCSSQIDWVSSLTKWLMNHGTRVDTIGSFPLHALMALSTKTNLHTRENDLIMWLLYNDTSLRERINERNEDGYTLLHIVANANTSNKGYSRKQQTAHVVMLLALGIDPSITDDQNRLAVDYLKKNKNFQAVEEIRRRAATTANQDSAVACGAYEDSPSTTENLTFEEVVSNFVQFCSQSDWRYLPNLFEQPEVLTLLQHLSICSEIPPGLLCTADSTFQTTLVKWCLERGQWAESLLLLTGHKNEKVQSKKRGLFPDCCLSDVNLSDLIPHMFKTNNLRLRLVSSLIEKGACPDGLGPVTEPPVTLCLKSEDYELAYHLLKEGADPHAFSVSSGDTPLHVALQIILGKKDEFGLHILKYLLQLFESNPQTYDYLDPNLQDENGNTLLHIIFASSSRHLEEIMDMLAKFDINTKVKNKQDKEATFKVSGKDQRLIYWKKALSNRKRQEPRIRIQRLKVSRGVTGTEMLKMKSVAEMDSCTKEMGSLQLVHCKDASSSVPFFECLVTEIKKLITCQHAQLVTSPATPEASGSVNNIHKELCNVSDTSNRYKVMDPESTTNECLKSAEQDVPEDAPEAEASLDVLRENWLQGLDFDNMTWEIECTTEVLKKLASKDVSLQMKAKIVQVIQQLGNGEWTHSLQKRLKHLGSKIRLYEAKLDKGARMLWELAVDFSPRCSENPEKIIESVQLLSQSTQRATGRVYSEMIRVWDIILDHGKLDHSIENICHAFNRGMMCILRKKLKGLNRAKISSSCNVEKRIPLCYIEYIDGQNTEEREATEYFPPASAVETEYNIMKFHSFSTNMAYNIISNMDIKVEYPFRVGELEYAIIDLNPSPLEAIILIGRSGTGKTTCCLYRLWKQFQKYWLIAEKINGPWFTKPVRKRDNFKQDDDEDADLLFSECSSNDDSDLTENEEDNSKLSAHCEQSMGASHQEDKSIAEADIDNNVQEQLEHLHQIFVTKNHVLCKEVQRNFVELTKSNKATSHFRTLEPNIHRLQDIQDEHYPLFVTSQQLLLLLDASMPEPFFPRNPDGSMRRSIVGWSAVDENMIQELEDDDEEGEFEEDLDEDESIIDIQLKEADPRVFVTYEVFNSEMWPKMIKGRSFSNPALVWKEIKSFLRGSFESFSSPDGFLSKEQYYTLGRKRAPNFQEDRSEIYSLFQIYQQIKRQRGYFDEEDILFNLSQRLSKLDEIPWSIHELYGDEIQDFTQAELMLLMKFINDPNAMFLTGDTAQSIMKGVAFRFSDLHSLFYYANKSGMNRRRRQRNTKQEQFIVRKPKRIYQLYQNYRSHSGILNMASGVVDLLQHFFPESFDRLPRDCGLFDGPKPTLMESCSVSDLAILLRGNKRKSQPIEFGAHQVILVANEAAKEAIPEELSLALVLTIYEAKGLEFDDVLLYNFFTDSEAGKEWRVISTFSPSRPPDTQASCLGELPMEGLSVSHNRPIDFNPDLQKMLNGELKQLYTAITRARVNLWLFDENLEKRGPAFEFFVNEGYVQVVTTDENLELDDSMFIKSSTQQEWIGRGDYFAKHHCWKVAAKCYQKGGDKNKEKLALANDSVLNLRSKKVTPRELQLEYLQLSKIYLECNAPKLSMKCLKNAKEYDLCGQLCERLGKFKDAAASYIKARKHKYAVKCYELDNEYDLALKAYCSAELFEEAAEALERYNQKLQTKLPYEKDNFFLQAAAKYHKERRHVEMQKSLSNLPSEEQLIFFKRYGYVKEAANVLKSQGRGEEAAELMREHGDLITAAELTARQDFRAECLLAEARRGYSVLQKSTNTNDLEVKHIMQVLKQANQLFKEMKQVIGSAEVLLLRGLINKDANDIRKACIHFVKEGHNAGAVEALHMLLCYPLDCVSNLLEYLKCFEMLIQLAKAVENPRTNGDKEIVKSCYEFYGIMQMDDTQCLIPKKEAGRVLNFMFDYGPGLQKNLIADDTAYRVQNRDLKVVIMRHLLGKLSDFAETIKSLCEDIPQVCTKYICGFDCQYEKCVDFHKAPQRHELKSSIHAKVYLVALNGMLLAARELFDRQIFSEVDNIENNVTKDAFAMVQSLFRTVFPKHFHLRTLSDSNRATEEILCIVRKIPFRCYASTIKDYVNQRIQEEKAVFQRESTDLWLEIFQVLLLTSGYPRDLDNLLIRVEQQYQNDVSKVASTNTKTVAGFHGMLPIEKGSKECISFFRLFLVSMRDLYQNKDPLKCVHSFYRFMNVIVKKNRRNMIPDIGNTVMLIEFQFVLTCFLLMRICGNLSMSLPKSYLTLLNLWDFLLKGSSSLVISNWYKPKELYKLRRHLEYLIGVMCGHVNSDFNVLVDASSNSSFIISGETERTVVLCLVMLINCIQITSPRFAFFIRSNLINVADTLKKVLKKEKCQVPTRLVATIDEVNNAKSMCDVIESLQVLLIQRDEEYLLDCTWDDSKRQIFFRNANLSRCQYILEPIQSISLALEAYDDTLDKEDLEEEVDPNIQSLKNQLCIQNKWRKAIWKCILLVRWMALVQPKPQSRESARFVSSNFPEANIDRTQCDLCGVKFWTHTSEGQLRDVLPDEGTSVMHDSDDLWEEGEPAGQKGVCDKKDYRSHVLSQEHKHKFQDYENYELYFSEHFDSLITSSKKIIQELKDCKVLHLPSKEQTEGKLEDCIQKITSVVKDIHKRKDWASGISEVKKAADDLRKSVDGAQKILDMSKGETYNYCEEKKSLQSGDIEEELAQEHEDFDELSRKSRKKTKKGRKGKR
ncbi:TPR and ankyrin repeat-containing protein 1-like [Erpetoichthys calabaricus]|uniref:TPR and ankyrin repeat-containing protein 1-like n=1 Tax=Erpetoichthys calabaricus TaxID=27687 RepID=UPI00223490B5|nr:TPR and ankyrin repeat-containing protein 1-like [Erpetoichthys calabaricus]XP_051792007.1 TPR and ankyrin repeat-containing protein 1-like [Erpetoichthys calabaricus]